MTGGMSYCVLYACYYSLHVYVGYDVWYGSVMLKNTGYKWLQWLQVDMLVMPQHILGGALLGTRANFYRVSAVVLTAGVPMFLVSPYS